jgi:hypothetical protein
MAVIETLGVVLGLAVMALMALTPALVALNDRFPPAARKTPAEAVVRSVHERPASAGLLSRHTPAHR